MKTYYTVKYSIMGGNAETAVFDNKKIADSFYETGDYRDKPQAHRISSQRKIAEYEELVNQTCAYLYGWLI